MTKTAIVVLLFLLSFSALGQHQPKSGKKPTARKATASRPAPTPRKEISEKEAFDTAAAITDPAERISALKGFSVNFPESPNRVSALELLAVSRASYAEEKMQAGETDTALIVFKQTVDEIPAPVSQKLFTETVYKIPATLYWRGQRPAALEIAKAIEGKVGENAAQLVDLATFYLGIEGGEDARRLAEKAVQLDPKSAPAYQALGLAYRLNFQLEESAQAYAKALETDPESTAARRSLAEMKRALGNSGEAASLYREILSKDEANASARTGMILSLFDAGKTSEAESELSKSLEQNPNNVVLLAGAAYWYAANSQPDKAVDLAQKAIASEPRYVWSHIALARGLIGQKKPLDAERILLGARQYGNFPTLEYEIAAARLMAGFYREAAEELKKNFSVKDGVIKTRLGGRVPKEDKGFVELLAAERRASIFAPSAADNPENAALLKSLLDLSEKIDSPESSETEIVRAADEFVAGDDGMKLHRQLYTADALVKKKLALPKVLELMHAAIGKADASLNVVTPGAAVMASELYESRSLAIARGELIRVPDVPRQMLSAIVRGRIEEITGWALHQQGSQVEAIVRLRRAVSVLPEKSAWWRSSVWKLGAALEADGKDKEALDSYIKSYITDKPDLVKYLAVERLYLKVNGSTKGLEATIGPNPLPVIAKETAEIPVEQVALKTEPSPQPAETASADQSPQPTSAEPKSTTAEQPQPIPLQAETAKDPAAETRSEQFPKVEPSPSPTVDESASAEPSPSPTPTEAGGVEETPKQSSELPPIIVGTQRPEPEKTPEVVETSTPEPVAAPSPTPTETTQISETPPQTPDVAASPSPTPETSPEAAATPSPTPEATPAAPATPSPTPETMPEAAGTPVPLPEPTSDFKTQDPAPEKVIEPPVDPADSSEIKPTTETASTSKTEEKPTASSKSSSTKQLFDPVIVTIPRGGISTVKKPPEKPSETAIAKNDPQPETAITEDEEQPAETNTEAPAGSGDTRKRVVEEKPVVVAETPKCEISASQDSISLLNNGGSLGLLIGIDGEGDIKTVKAVSASPQDIAVTLEPEIAGVASRAFYIVKSISANTGTFKITFEAPCGRKDVTVTVR